MKKKQIYLDYQASTPLDSRVLDVMMPYLTERFGNPHSASHAFGWEGEAALDIAREQVSDLIGGASGEVIFMSGATEANNLAIKGVMERFGHARPKIVTCETEHSCVLNSARWCASRGYELEIVPVKPDGIIDLERLSDAVDDRTAIVSVMAVNNEIGVIQPLKQISEIARKYGAIMHSDAAQATGKIALDMDTLGVDLLSISGHKLYGPKGVGALWRRNERRVMFEPQMHGGGQEGGLRSGTQAPALVAGLGKACAIAMDERAQEETRLTVLRDRFMGRLQDAIGTVSFNGSTSQRWVGNMNIAFPGAKADLLISGLRDIAVSSGAACASSKKSASHVLTALGLNEKQIESSLRIGFGRMTTEDEVDMGADALIRAVEECRKLTGWKNNE